MRYLFIGLLAGALLGLAPVFEAGPAIEIYPEWYGPAASPESIERSPNGALSGLSVPPVVSDDSLTLLAGDGRILLRRSFPDDMFTVSANGAYYATYRKTGTSVEFFSAAGSPFWKTDSREYPHLSYNGKIVLLVNSDQSRARALNFHGNEVGEPVTGRFLTVAAFSKGSDFAAVGFLDGSYSIIDAEGKRLFGARTGGGTLVKSMAVSPSGLYAALHYGNEKGDYLAIVDTRKGGASASPLARVHVARTALTVGDDGLAAALDHNRILVVDSKARPVTTINVPAARTGMATLDRSGPTFAAGYTRSEGGAQSVLFLSDGTVLFARNFPAESYLQASVEGRLIFLRGPQTLYCYSLHLR